MIYNVYCDESCHLENDSIDVMVLGAIWCPKSMVKKINQDIKSIKQEHGVKFAELKWTKISSSKENLYLDLVEYFLNNDDLHFRCLIANNKKLLNHSAFQQNHDIWYYKMYFNMLKFIFNSWNQYEVYIDIKDTYSYKREEKLHDVCANNMYDFDKTSLLKIQPIRSHEIQIMQVVDILTGAVARANRYDIEMKSPSKKAIIERLNPVNNLSKNSNLSNHKFNIFHWNPQEVSND